MANWPDVLLADEPTGNLDQHSVQRILELFARLRAERPAMTMIVVTHDPLVAASTHRTVRLRDGRVDDSPGDGRAQAQTRVTCRSPDDAD